MLETRIRAAAIALATAMTACAAPMTQSAIVSKDVVRAEQFKQQQQQQLVVQSGVKEQKRVEDIGYPLLVAARRLCGDRVAARTGVRVANVHNFAKEYQPAARSLGFSDTLTVVGVAKSSAAERAGIGVGDRVLQVGVGSIQAGANAQKEFLRRLDDTRNQSREMAITVRKGTLALMGTETGTAVAPASEPATLALSVPPDTVCAYGLLSVKDDALNAWADGKDVYITTAMMRFAADDNELAIVIAHEIAHNAMRHIDAKKKNATVGALLGAALDVAAATQGVNTSGAPSPSRAASGTMRCGATSPTSTMARAVRA